MATNASPFVVNIVDLQNIATGISGSSKDSQLAKIQSDIGNIQEMVNYDTKTLSADIFTSFTPGQTIDVMASLNLSNASLYTNSNQVTLNTSTTTNGPPTQINSLGGSVTGITVNTLPQTISFITAGTQSLLMNASGNAIFSNNVYIGGNVYVTNIIQTSDIELKNTIEPFTTTVDDVLKLTPYTFKWLTNGACDLGFIAQDVKESWSTLTETHPDGTLGIVYSRFVPLLIESIRELNNRIIALESNVKDYLRAGISSINNGGTCGNE
jgi:hypothetical protein